MVAGDGGFQMTMAELATIVQEKLNVKIAIINNGYLGMVRQWQEFFYEGRYASTPLLSPDFVKLAEAYGIPALTVTQRAQVIPALQTARFHAGAGADRFPRGAGRFRLPDGAGRRGLARHDPAAHSARRKSLRMSEREAAAYIRRLRGEQAGRAEPHGLAVSPPRLQHRVAHRRPHRAAGRLAHDHRFVDRRGRRRTASKPISTSW